jgi:uncharacterized BrkB/YihY/UPF0761 family membrane protein
MSWLPWSCREATIEILKNCPQNSICDVIPFCLEPLIISFIFMLICLSILYFILPNKKTRRKIR